MRTPGLLYRKNARITAKELFNDYNGITGQSSLPGKYLEGKYLSNTIKRQPKG